LYFHPKKEKLKPNNCQFFLFDDLILDISVNQTTMMFSFKLLFKLICWSLLISFFSCNSGTTKLLPYQSQLNQTFDLRYGTTVGLPDEQIEISFEKLTESRCPEGVNCVQAGEGIASLLVKVGDQSEHLVLKVKGLCKDEPKCGEAKSVLNYTLTLMSLDPYPSKVLEDKQKYVAKMIVTKKPTMGETR